MKNQPHTTIKPGNFNKTNPFNGIFLVFFFISENYKTNPNTIAFPHQQRYNKTKHTHTHTHTSIVRERESTTATNLW